MRRWMLLLALVGAFVVAAAITVGVPKLSLARYVVVGAVVCLAPGVVETSRKRDFKGIALLLAGAVGAPLVLSAAWLLAHPVVHVDDATDAPMQIWIDGEPTLVVAPTHRDEEPPRMRVPWGRRALGWSEVGASRPREEVRTSIDPAGDFLYSPRSAGCYWIEATSYGASTLHDVAHGPQRVQEVYRFPRVDVWFGDNPKSLQRSLFRRGDVSIALQRYERCMQLGAEGCDVDAREDFVECETALHGPAPNGDCFADALAACKKADKK